jgi:hypothetical protein
MTVSGVLNMSAAPSAPLLYPINIYRAVQDKKPCRRVEVSESEFLQLLSTTRAVDSKEAAGLFSSLKFIDPTMEARKLAGISSVHAIIGDIDGAFDPAKFDEGAKTLREAGLTAALYQTYSSTPEAQRWRVVVLLDEPIPPSAYLQCWTGLDVIFGGILDKNAKDASRLSYLPSHPPGESRRAFLIGGDK